MNTAPDPGFPAAEPGGGESGLPAQPGTIRRFWTRYPRTADTVLAVIWGGIACTGAVEPNGRVDVFVIVLIIIAVAGIYVRRRNPLVTLAACGAVILASVWAAGDIVLAPAVFAVYTVPAHRSTRAGWAAAAAVELAGVVAAAVARMPSGANRINPFNPAVGTGVSVSLSVIVFALQFALILALALVLGINVGNRRRYLAALIDRAHRLEVERDQQAQLATAAERARIAREMHDIVSHSLTVMITLAEGSAVVAEADTPDAAAAMRKAAETGRSAMVDMRRMLGVLGGENAAGHAPQPGYADIPGLIERYRSLGLPVDHDDSGAVPEDPAVQLAAYRVIQEGLTNALRYAHGPTSVAVRTGIRDGALRIVVADDGLPGFPGTPAGTGRGLLGLRERLTALGGSLTAGPPVHGHGWRLEAAVPLDDREVYPE